MNGNAPDCVLINCRNPHGGDTYVARAKTMRVQASSTMGRRVAVERCAEKIYGVNGFKLHQYTAETWVVSPNAPLERSARSDDTLRGDVRP